MRKIGIIAVLSLLVTAFAAVPVLAQNPQEVANNPLTATLQETGDILVTGSIAGLGQGNVDILVEGDFACEVRPGVNQPGGHLQAGEEDVTPRGGRVNIEETLPAGTCPPGLNPVSPEVVTVTIFEAGTDIILFQQEVAVT